MEKRVKITTHCVEGICPICGGRLYYTDTTPDYNLWKCCTCGATGMEGKDYDSEGNAIFDNLHYDVRLNCGIPVDIEEAPAEGTSAPAPEPCTIDTVCKENICPICGSKIDYTGNDEYAKWFTGKEWKCPKCGATGWARYEEETIYTFAGEHTDVSLADGTPVNIIAPPKAGNH